MSAREHLKQGDVDQAVKALFDEVRNQPDKAQHRVFLFQLLSVTGDWNRALTQLNVARELDQTTAVMGQAYQEILQCEALRGQVFAGTRTPMVLGDPAPWIATMIEALRNEATGNAAAADSLREQALAEAPALSGSIDRVTAPGAKETASEPFEWIADGDSRLGPLLETIVNGRYYWVPWQYIAEVQLDPVTDLRDLVWAPAHFRWTNGGEAVGVIPTRYAATEAQTDGPLRLARTTTWSEPRPGVYHGLGQRVFVTDAGECGLLELRRISLDQTPPSEA